MSAALASYGHSTPSTMAGRSFCMVYALIGIPLGLVMFQSIGERLNTIVRVALRNVKRFFKTKNPEVTQTNLVMVVLVLSTILMTSMAAIFAKYERWEYFDALYYCFITLTTIGFGDYVALQKESALQSKPEYVILSLVFILFGLSVVSSAVNLLVLKFLTLNTEDERRDEQIRSTAALDPYELKGVEITMNASKQQLAAAAAAAKPQSGRHKAARLSRASSSDNAADEERNEEQEEQEDEASQLVLDSRLGTAQPFEHTYADKRHGESEPDEPDLKYCNPDGLHEPMQLHRCAHNWRPLCHEFESPPTALHAAHLSAGHCCFRRELAPCRVALSKGCQLDVWCQEHRDATNSRRRHASSRSQHTSSVQCDEQSSWRVRPSGPTTSADDDDDDDDDDGTTTSSRKLASPEFGDSARGMASSGERSRDQLAPVADRAHLMSSACNHCDRHFHYSRQLAEPEARTSIIEASPCRQRRYHGDQPRANQTKAGAACSLSSVRIKPLSDSDESSNQSMARGALRRPNSEQSPSAVQQRHHVSSFQQGARHSNSCSCSNESLHRRQLEWPSRPELGATQRPLALCDAPPSSRSPHLLLNPSRLQEQQLVAGPNRQQDVGTSWNRSRPGQKLFARANKRSLDADEIGRESLRTLHSSSTNHRLSTASLAQQYERQSSWLCTPQSNRHQIGPSALSLSSNLRHDLEALSQSLERARQTRMSGPATGSQNWSANELERSTSDALLRRQKTPKLLCKCCCQHDECVKYALKQAASLEANVGDESRIWPKDDAHNDTHQRPQPTSSTNDH